MTSDELRMWLRNELKDKVQRKPGVAPDLQHEAKGRLDLAYELGLDDGWEGAQREILDLLEAK